MPTQFPVTIELSALNGINGFTINGIAAFDNSGISVSTAGDINNDGVLDLIIGAPYADPNGSKSGQSYVVFGDSCLGVSGTVELSNLNGTDGFKINGIAVDDRSGFSVSSVGDVNTDGVVDLLIGAYWADPNGSNSGQSYVVFGGSSVGSSGTLELSNLNGANGFRINGIAGLDYSGYSVSGAGDINGDGIADLIIGAYKADPNGSESGQSYVVFGGAGVGVTGTIELSSLDGVNGFMLNGIATFDRSGISVSQAGDINADGVDDLIIGAYQADPNGANSGQSYVVFGSNAVFNTTIELSNLNGSNGFKINGIVEGDISGRSVSQAGDINADGVPDLVIGAPGADPNALGSGQSYVIFGNTNIGSTGIVELSDLAGVNGFKINGATAGDISGSVSTAGDINNDGITDFIIGAWAADSNGLDSGQSYVVFGGASVGSTGTIDLSSLTGANGFMINGITAGDRSGFSVSLAGDINNDGVGDFIIGAYRANPNGVYSGQSYVVFGEYLDWYQNSLSIGRGQARLLLPENINATSSLAGTKKYFEISSCTHGFFALLDNLALPIASFNETSVIQKQVTFVHDGSQYAPSYSLKLVSLPLQTSATSTVTVYFDKVNTLSIPLFELSNLNGANGFRLNGIAAGDYSGISVSAAGDVNGDGVMDFLIGAWGAGPNGLGSGQSYVVFGGISVGSSGTIELSNLNGSNGFILNGIAVNDRSGISVSTAGDINADGMVDLLIGAHAADPNGSGSGQCYVVFGGVSIGSGGTIELSNLNGINGFTLNGIAANDWSGFSVSAAGDINGDGVIDLLIGAYGADPNGSYSGQSYVVFGGAGVGSGGTIELSSLNGSNGFKLNGIAAYDYSGSSVSQAGDVNGDGITDLIIGAWNADPNGVDSGQSYVVFGGSNVGSSGAFELSNLNGINGFIVNGTTAGDRNGRSVSSAGDINADNIDDLIIGAYWANPNGPRSGQSYVLLGGTDIGSSGAIDLASLNGNNGFKINGFIPGDKSGVSVSNAGDVNSDGITDLIIGAFEASPNGFISGQSYIAFGGTGIGVTGVLELSSLNGANGFTLNGIAAGDKSGRSVSGLGDINGDGVADLLIGAYRANPNGPQTGQSYVVFGERAPEIINNQIQITDGSEVILTNQDLLASSTSMNDDLIQYTLTNLQNGRFELVTNPDVPITQFTQQDITNGQVRLVHFAGLPAPIYAISTTGIRTLGSPEFATVSFIRPPELITNQLVINEGETKLITNSELKAIDADEPDGSIRFNISNVKYGKFTWVSDSTTAITSFTQRDIWDGKVQFVHDGSENSPSYLVSLSDASVTTDPQIVTVLFEANVNDIPQITTNQLSIHRAETKVLTPVDLSATDPDDADQTLLFNVIQSERGHFELTTALGRPITEFYQLQIQQGQVQFAMDDVTIAPRYNISAFDGKGSSPSQQAKIKFDPQPLQTASTVTIKPKSNAVRNAVIGSVVSGFVGLLFLAAKIYIKRKSDKQMAKALEGDTESAAGQRAQYFKEVVSPIAKKIFGKLGIKNFFGISDKKLGEFLDAIAKLADECQARGVPVNDLPNMEPAKATSLINEIAKQTKQVLAPTSSIAGTIVHFFRRQVTPEQIEDASIMIASFVKTAWDSSEKRARIYSQAEGIEMTALESNTSASDVGQNNPIFDAGVGAVTSAGSFGRPSEQGDFATLLAGFKEEFQVEIQRLESKNQVLQERLEQVEGRQSISLLLPPPMMVPRP